MHVVIAVASRHGSTAEIAEVLAQELRSAGHVADVLPIDGSTTIAAPDAVVIGSAIYMGGWLPEARQFVERNWLRLAGVPTWLFSSGPLGHNDPQPNGELAQLQTLLARTGAREHRMFVGRLDRRLLSLGERLIASLVKAPQGDFRDWAAIRAWARDLAAALALVSAAQNDSMESALA
jgi:menaquinone-dependent protoporphyrinogen oxidase